MQEITTQVPAYIFAAVNLLLLAYFNRFHALSTRIRDLASKDRMKQVIILRKRLQYARNMILYGIASIFTGMIDILVIACGYQKYGWIIFVIAILLVGISLLYAAKEIWDGTIALDDELTSHDCNTYKSEI